MCFIMKNLYTANLHMKMVIRHRGNGGIFMGIDEGKKLIHWNYFLALDSDAEKLSRYIEFTKNNADAYSIEMVRLLLSAASEVDVVAKLLCSKMDPSKKAKDIDDYRTILNQKLPKIGDMKILIPRYGCTLTPWQNWKTNKNPNWWSDHNAVKHQRDINFQKANLKNTLNSIAGLFCLLLYYYKDEAENCELIPEPNLFYVSHEFIRSRRYDVYRPGSSIKYKL